MCGIFGVVDSGVELEHLQAASAILEHRGPDGNGIYLDRDLNVGLAHSRLAVVDLKTGNQPLFDPAREIILVCNGEIYDFENIRSSLENEGFRFQTTGDSEVIVHLYLKWGLGLFEHLRGEFAFLLLDRKKGVLIACRDRFGIKPLFLAATDSGGWVFGSEMKAIFASKLKKAELQIPMDSLHENSTFFRGVYELPPGTALVVGLTDRRHEVITYWSPDFPKSDAPQQGLSFAECMAKADALLTESIRHRLRADVPVGVYLSGGIDSALVAAKVREISDHPPLAFTVSFSDMPDFDEKVLAGRISAHLGMEQHVVEVSTNDLWANLEDCLWHTEYPIGDFAPVAKYLLSQLAAQHVKVVLTGEGSDEVFLGYKYFRRRLQFHQRSPAPASRLLQRCRREAQSRFRRFIILLATRRRVLESPNGNLLSSILPGQISDPSQTMGRHPLIVDQYHWLKKHLLKTILVSYADRPEMAHSVEGRVPYLDHRLFELARDIPVEFKIHEGKEKYIIREIARGLVPAEVLDREKWPFSTKMPSFDTARYPASARIWNTYLSRQGIRDAGLFRWYAVAALKFSRRFRWFRRYADAKLFHVACLQILHKFFVQGHHPEKC